MGVIFFNFKYKIINNISIVVKAIKDILRMDNKEIKFNFIGENNKLKAIIIVE